GSPQVRALDAPGPIPGVALSPCSDSVQMPLLAAADRPPALDIQQVLRHFDFPSLDVVIVDQIVERAPERAPEMLERLRPAAAEVAQRCHLDRIGLGMAGAVEV